MLDAPWMQTYTGLRFNLGPDDYYGNVINPLDIAHGLSNISRWGGHTKTFYSVAQHSVLVSYACPTKPLAGLLHDASEAFLGDIVSPLKKLIPGYDTLERQLQNVIAFRFGLDEGDFHCKEVKDADMLLLAMERRDLLTTPNFTWTQTAEIPVAFNNRINPVSSSLARKYFMDRFYELTGVKGKWKEEDDQDRIQEALEKAKETEV